MTGDRVLEIVEVAPGHELFGAWYDVYALAAAVELGELSTVWQLGELEQLMLPEQPTCRRTGVLGLVDGLPVASGFLSLPMLDNLSSAELRVHTHPDHQRQGWGSALVADLESRASAAGRVLLDSEARWRFDLGTDGAGSPGVGFAARHGYRLVLSDVQRELPLPVASSLLDDLQREAAAHHGAYTVESWVGPVPERWVESWLALESSLMTEAPTGDREVESTSVDVEAWRSREASMARQQRQVVHSVALDAAGEVVAYSDFCVPGLEPGRVYQWGTLVARAHRGHRLGLAVKVANLRLVQAEFPEAEHVMTWNAESNTHMVGVNQLLGFRPVARLGEFQKRLA